MKRGNAKCKGGLPPGTRNVTQASHRREHFHTVTFVTAASALSTYGEDGGIKAIFICADAGKVNRPIARHGANGSLHEDRQEIREWRM